MLSNFLEEEEVICIGKENGLAVIAPIIHMIDKVRLKAHDVGCSKVYYKNVKILFAMCMVGRLNKCALSALCYV